VILLSRWLLLNVKVPPFGLESLNLSLVNLVCLTGIVIDTPYREVPIMRGIHGRAQRVDQALASGSDYLVRVVANLIPDTCEECLSSH
jgi:hypothetical protein